MDKKQIKTLIKNIAYSQDYEILSGTHEHPEHIRIKGKCDIWSNGTFKSHTSDKYIKGSKGIEALAKLFNVNVKDKMNAKIEKQNESINRAFDMIGTLQNEVEQLREQNKHLTQCMEDLQFTIETMQRTY